MWPDPLGSVTRTRAVPGRTSRGTGTWQQLISHWCLKWKNISISDLPTHVNNFLTEVILTQKLDSLTTVRLANELFRTAVVNCCHNAGGKLMLISSKLATHLPTTIKGIFIVIQSSSIQKYIYIYSPDQKHLHFSQREQFAYEEKFAWQPQQTSWIPQWVAPWDM